MPKKASSMTTIYESITKMGYQNRVPHIPKVTGFSQNQDGSLGGPPKFFVLIFHECVSRLQQKCVGLAQIDLRMCVGTQFDHQIIFFKVHFQVLKVFTRRIPRSSCPLPLQFQSFKQVPIALGNHQFFYFWKVGRNQLFLSLQTLGVKFGDLVTLGGWMKSNFLKSIIRKSYLQVNG